MTQSASSMISYNTFQRELHRIFSQDPALNAMPLEHILDAIPTIDQMQDVPHGSTVLLRLDLDVPLKDGEIEDSSRIESILPTLRYCIERSWKIVILAHIGRDKTLSLLPVCKAISKEIAQDIEFISDWLDETEMKILDEAVLKIARAKPGSIILLENTRKYDLERALWKATEEVFPEICQNMYALAQDFRERIADIEVNEAVAASNFDFSSSVLPLAMSRTGFGFYISQEMRHIRGTRQANMIVMSGLKIDKLNDLEGIIERNKARWLIVAGSLAMALKKAQAQLEGRDFFIGKAETDQNAKSYIAPERIEQAKRIVQRCLEDRVDLVLPIDFVLDNGDISQEIPDGRLQFDIGPETRQLISLKLSEYIAQSKKSSEPFAMFYNGVFGKFEDPKYAAGTRDFVSHLRKMTAAGILTYVGGGEGRFALLRYGDLADVTHAFTAGGTILKSLSDKHIQFLKAMYLQNVVESPENRQ